MPTLDQALLCALVLSYALHTSLNGSLLCCVVCTLSSVMLCHQYICYIEVESQLQMYMLFCFYKSKYYQ